jgi:hypothetical protein
MTLCCIIIGCGKQREHARVELHPGEVDELDADLMAGRFNALGENGGQGSPIFG